MLTPRQRIEKQKSSSSLISLYRALVRLTSPLTIMNTGAHPDDEQSGMLAFFSLGLGMRVIVGCSTRGEGGQNVLGPERLGALGVLRTREMEEAARILDADIHWLGHGPDDPVHDFGFSKDGDGTFAHWGKERTVERLVRAYRQERPDIVIPTFLDVPGQHGHHRAMTRAAETALALAADETAYPEHFNEGLKPWTVAKYYLPAWSGGGGTYDDETPPPAATLNVVVNGTDFATGADFDRIGQWSRYYHASQGMGHWPQRPDRTWPLHLLHGPKGSQAEASILEDMPATLEALCATSTSEPALRQTLAAADTAIQQAINAYPDRNTIKDHLIVACEKIEFAKTIASEDFLTCHSHRLERKLSEIDAALFEATPIFERAYANVEYITPGGNAELNVVLAENVARDVTVAPQLPDGMSATCLSSDDGIYRFALKAENDIALSNQYPPLWSSLGGNSSVSIKLSANIGSRLAHGCFDLETQLPVAPAQSVTIKPDAILLPLNGELSTRQFDVSVSSGDTSVDFSTPKGWKIGKSGDHWQLHPPQTLIPGLTTITPVVSGKPGFNITPFAYPHIGRSRFIRPETLNILALDLSLPDGARIGYISGGADHVAKWLIRMGLNVTELDAEALAGDLSAYTTIVVGIFAYGTRPDLAAAAQKLHRFVEDGGHLVTLYHRPSDGWTPESTPPRFIKIGSPSLRWRITNPKAEVRILVPDHPLIRGPNRITVEDWDGWQKERGLYFSAEWDDAYQPLLSMHDPDEQPMEGAMISARIGKGRHTHTSLVLHHQMDKLVPGAFRLMANLVQPA